MEAIKLIRYVHATRKRYLKTLNELPWDEVIKDRGASFASIRDVFLHALNVEDRLVNYVILKNEEWNPKGFAKFSNMIEISERLEEVEEKVEKYLQSVTNCELDRKVQLPWRTDPLQYMRVEDVLIHIAVEHISHMGELIALLWQFDKQPPFLSWSLFLEESA